MELLCLGWRSYQITTFKPQGPRLDPGSADISTFVGLYFPPKPDSYFHKISLNIMPLVNAVGKPVYNLLYRWIWAGPSQPNNNVIIKYKKS